MRNRRVELYDKVTFEGEYCSYVMWIHRKWHQFRKLKNYGVEDEYYTGKYKHRDVTMDKEFDEWLERNADNFNPFDKVVEQPQQGGGSE